MNLAQKTFVKPNPKRTVGVKVDADLYDALKMVPDLQNKLRAFLGDLVDENHLNLAYVEANR